MERYIEERTEVCSVASKLVKLKIYKTLPSHEQSESVIVDFQCNQSSSSCDSRCTYKLLMSDY